MRLRLALWVRLATLVAAVLLILSWARGAQAEDRVIMRGNYYREASTRVLQPLVDVSVDVPDERLTLGAQYMLDAISSASIASGAATVTGGDNVFTELRHEASARVGSRLGAWTLGAFFRYSTETDYNARSVGASVGRDVLERSGTVSVGYAYNFDRIYRIINNVGERAPWCGGNNATVCDLQASESAVGNKNLLQVHYLALGYTHALTRTMLGGLTLEGVHARGPQDNAYRSAQILNGLDETHPQRRNRLAITPNLRWMIPKAHMVLEPRYRYYVDSWKVQAHNIDTRIHFRVLRHLRLRLRYRFYIQSEAFLWRDDGQYAAPLGPCTTDAPENCASADPKLDNWLSHTPGIQVVYELDGLARRDGFGWLDGAWIEATYNRVFQTNRFGDAHLGSLAFSLAF